MNEELLSRLIAEFAAHAIPITEPGFMDHPNFLDAERKDPAFLELYAAFVIARTYDSQYLDRARVRIQNAVRIMQELLIENGRLGACVDIAMILSRILEREGVWNFATKGSLTIDFPANSGHKSEYFWSIDYGNFVAAHAWVVAPPFRVIDLTIQRQDYPVAKIEFIPKIVIREELDPYTTCLDDVISPAAQEKLANDGLPKSSQLRIKIPQLDRLNEFLPAGQFVTEFGTRLKYSPVGIGMCQEPLEKMSNMRFGGRLPHQIYTDKFLGKLDL